MTYSRPSTRSVDALQSVGTPNAIEVKGSSRVDVSANGKVIDARDPNQLIRNQEAKSAVITNFIDSVTNAGTKLYKGYLEDQANDQIGELLANTSPEDLMSVTTDGPQRDAIRKLNPFAQDKLEALQGQYGVNKYQESYLSENKKNQAVLTNPSTSDEVKTQITNDIRQTSREVSGLANLSPRTLSRFGENILAFEGQVSGQNYANTNERQKERDLAKLQNGLLSTVTPLLSSEGPSGRGNIEAVQAALEREISDPTPMFTPKEKADELFSGIQARAQMLIASGNADEAVTLSNRMVELAGTSIQTPSGEYFFDIKDGQGKSLTLKLSELATFALRQQEIQGGRTVKELTGEYLVEYNEETSPEGKELLNQTYMGEIAALPAPQRAAALAAMGSVQGDLDRPTELQIKNAAQAMLDISRKGLNEEDSRARLLKEVDKGAITASQYAGLMRDVANGNPDESLYNDIATAETRYQNEASIAAQALIEVGSIDPNGEGTAALTGYDDEAKKIIIEGELKKGVVAALEKKAKEARDNGTPWTTQMMVDNYSDELARQSDILRERLAKGQLGGKTRLSQINEEYTTFLDNTKEGNGPLSIDSFAPETVRRWKEQNKNKEPTVKALLGELSRQLKPLKDSNGELIYPEIVKDLKGVARRSRVSEDEYGFWERSNPLNYLMGIPSLEEVDTMQQKIDQTPDKKPEKKEEKVSQKVEIDEKDPKEGFKKVLMQGLGALGNVITAPSKAGTLEGKPGVINSDSTSEFAKVMARQVPLGIKTQALPQVSAASEVRRAPIAISNRNHPFFVAIGIAEGTRTPSGANTKAYYGHTDIGDGNLNVGTVSGGRNGGSPQQVDRQWMGILTSVSATMAPKLQALGLRPNSQGWNRLMFNILDLRVQATPPALTSFVMQLPKLIKQGLTIEAIAKARADSYINPATGRLEASGFNNNYSRLFADQRSRAGVYDYKRRF